MSGALGRSLPGLPTGRADWRLMARTARLVLGGPGYAALALVASVAALSLFVLSLNLPLVEFALVSDLALGSRLTILVGLYPFLGPGFGVVQGVLLLAVAALTGVDVAMAVYHVREHDLSAGPGAGSSASSSGRSAPAAPPAGRRCWRACSRCSGSGR